MNQLTIPERFNQDADSYAGPFAAWSAIGDVWKNIAAEGRTYPEYADYRAMFKAAEEHTYAKSALGFPLLARALANLRRRLNDAVKRHLTAEQFHFEEIRRHAEWVDQQAMLDRRNREAAIKRNKAAESQRRSRRESS